MLEIKLGSSNSSQISGFYLIGENNKEEHVYYRAEDASQLAAILKDIRNMSLNEFNDIILTLETTC